MRAAVVADLLDKFAERLRVGEIDQRIGLRAVAVAARDDRALERRGQRGDAAVVF